MACLINFFVLVSGAEQTAFDYRDRIKRIPGAFFRRLASEKMAAPAYLPRAGAAASALKGQHRLIF
jgi:hypothetical protein